MIKFKRRSEVGDGERQVNRLQKAFDEGNVLSDAKRYVNKYWCNKGGKGQSLYMRCIVRAKTRLKFYATNVNIGKEF